MNNSYLAVLSIKIPVKVPIINVQVGRNDGSVICSDYDFYTREYVKPEWKFTTLKSPVDGDHLVGGNRQFGYFKNYDGSYTFYTRGVDRLQLNYILREKTFGVDGCVSCQETISYVNEGLSDLAFSESDKLWSSFQKGLLCKQS